MHLGDAGSFAGLGGVVRGDLPFRLGDLGGLVVANELVDARLIGHCCPLIAVVVDVGIGCQQQRDTSQGAGNPAPDGA